MTAIRLFCFLPTDLCPCARAWPLRNLLRCDLRGQGDAVRRPGQRSVTRAAAWTQLGASKRRGGRCIRFPPAAFGNVLVPRGGLRPAFRSAQLCSATTKDDLTMGVNARSSGTKAWTHRQTLRRLDGAPSLLMTDFALRSGLRFGAFWERDETPGASRMTFPDPTRTTRHVM